MHPNSLDLLLAFLLILTAITSWVMHQREVDANWRCLHLTRMLDIRTQQRDEARTERDRALAHADEAQQLLTLHSVARHPSAPLALTVIEGGEGA